MNPAQILIDGGVSFEFPHDTCEGRTVMMNFRFFHPSLPSGVAKEFEDVLKWALPIIDDVGKGSSLPVLEKFFSCDDYF